MDKVYADKQRELLGYWQKNKLKRINLLEGSVRSGKTWISLVLWAFWVATMPEDENYLMVAKTLTSLRRNCLDLLQTLVGQSNFNYSLSKKEGRLFGRLIYLEGVNDARAESKIRGMTLQGAYCDELTLFTEDFFSMLLSRLSVCGAKLIATTNPDNPHHWLKQKYVDRQGELDMLAMQFLIDDNPYLDRGYIDNLKKEYTGVFYDRFILGRWVIAEGLVYPMFDPSKHVFRDLPKENEQGGLSGSQGKNDGLWYISVDYGTLNPCSMGLWLVKSGKAYRVKEYYHDGRKSKRQMTDDEYYNALVKLAGKHEIQAVVVDPSAASFIALIRRRGKFVVRKAKNDVLDGIRVTAGMLNAGCILIHEDCKDCINEFRAYAWDDKAKEDKVVKESDHAMDDIRYFCNTVLRREWKWDIGAVNDG